MSHRFISWAIKRRDSGSQMQEAGNPQDQRCLIVRYDRIEIRNEFASPHQTPFSTSRLQIDLDFVFDAFFFFFWAIFGSKIRRFLLAIAHVSGRSNVSKLRVHGSAG